MRSVGTDPICIRSLVVVVAISAIHAAGGCPGCEQAWHIGVFADSLDRMIGGIHGIELQTLVRLEELPIDPRRTARDAIGVAPEAEFVFEANGGDNCPG